VYAEADGTKSPSSPLAAAPYDEVNFLNEGNAHASSFRNLA